MLQVIEAMRPSTGDGRCIFPNSKSDAALLDCVGFTKEKITPHGFRGMDSTILNEDDLNSDHIELQPAYVDENRVRAAYNYEDFLDDRAAARWIWDEGIKSLGRLVVTGSLAA